MRILIVEDDPVTAHLISRLCKTWGYEATVARDGKGALKAFESEFIPQLVLLNWVLPDIEGPSLCRRMKMLLRSRHAHIIMLTARGSQAEVQTAIEAGAAGYLLKPVNPREFRARLDDLKQRLDKDSPPAAVA
jgi:DNA-binding response OmpR family regulator